MIRSLFNLLSSVQPTIDAAILTKKNTSSTDGKIRELVTKLNDDFARREKSNPAAGYLVKITTEPSLKANLFPQGSRNGGALSGIDENDSNNPQKCLFCTSNTPLATFEDKSYALMSLSNQVLVIPKEHYPHWFTIPLETQVKLIKHILDIRNANSVNVQKPIEFHCGSAAGQTVFHFHGRTGVYLNGNSSSHGLDLPPHIT